MRLTTILSGLSKNITKTMNNNEKEWFVQMPWGRLGVMAWGDSTNSPVLFCHGKQDAASSFRPLVSKLPQNFFYVAVDLPGNGKSDHFSRGLPITTFDFVQTIKLLVDHFNWRKFAYVGHSLGSLIGKYYNFAYPGKMTKMVDLDPVPGYYTVEVEDFSKWVWKFYGRFFDEYSKFNATKDTAPKYTYQQCFDMIKRNRILSDEATKHALERNIEPVGDGLYRFTFDQRMKMVVRPPLPAQELMKLYASIDIPVHTVLAKAMLENGFYDEVKVPFLLDDSIPRRSPYSVAKVEGYHDVHITHPELVAPSVAQFLLNDFSSQSHSKSKL